MRDIQEIVIKILDQNRIRTNSDFFRDDDRIRLRLLISKTSFLMVKSNQIPFNDVLYYEPRSCKHDGIIRYTEQLLDNDDYVIANKVIAEILLYYAPSRSNGTKSIISSVWLALYHVGMFEYQISYTGNRTKIIDNIDNDLGGIILKTEMDIILSEEKIKYYIAFQLTHMDTHISKFVKCNEKSFIFDNYKVVSYFKYNHYITKIGIELFERSNRLPYTGSLKLNSSYHMYRTLMVDGSNKKYGRGKYDIKTIAIDNDNNIINDDRLNQVRTELEKNKINCLQIIKNSI